MTLMRSTCCDAEVKPSPLGWPRCRSCGRIQRDVPLGAEDLDAPAEPGFLYLASPYSHKDPVVRQRRYESAQMCVYQYLQRRVWVYSPIVHCHPLSLEYALPGDAKFWEDFNHAMIASSQGIRVLTIPGWQESLGVTEEISFARERGLSVKFVSRFGVELLNAPR